jgi:osmoprotectant transport system permease protein
MKLGFIFCTFVFFFLASTVPVAAAETVTVGSKIFTESYILGEIAAEILENASQTVNRKLGMGSTGILFESLKSGAIDVYPDYTGTLAEAILKNPNLKSQTEIKNALVPLGLTISEPLGFNNTYALAVKEAFAEKHQLRTLSDLAKQSANLRAAFSYEFMDRKDGYFGMKERYGFLFPADSVHRMEHSLAYQAIDEGAVDITEVYSTDAKIKKFSLRVLKDDLAYFPAYQAVWVARIAFVNSNPEAWKRLSALQGQITEEKMLALNAKADLDKKSFAEVASEFLGKTHTGKESRASSIAARTKEHLILVGISLLFSLLIGIPLGIFAVRYKIAGQGILLLSGLVQTIPSLALLCFLIPLFGVGTKPALVALCLYSLLPVVLNTFTGVRSVDPKDLENARAFGLSPGQILFQITLPLASPTLLAGVKTATIVSIGTATLAALVGAGGYGASIVSGLALNDIPTILEGAIPAALMALLAFILFDGIAWMVIPKGLRKRF